MGSSAMTHNAMQPHSNVVRATIYPYSRLTTLDVGMIREATPIPLSYSNCVGSHGQKNLQNPVVMVV